jgi:hypothetical protein
MRSNTLLCVVLSVRELHLATVLLYPPVQGRSAEEGGRMRVIPYLVALVLGAVIGVFSGMFGIFCLLLVVIVSYELIAGLGTERLLFLRAEEFPISLIHVGFMVGAVLSLRRFYGDDLFASAILFLAFGLIVGFVTYGSKKIFSSLHRSKTQQP